MKVILQRVSEARVRIDDVVAGEIGTGLMILFCAEDGDLAESVERLAAKISKLRIFADDAGKMNRCILDCAGSALIVSQFTLAANTSKGNRPSFIAAAPPDRGKQLYEQFCHAISNLGIPVATGQFGADMQVELINDGPVTIPLEIAAPPL